MAAEGVVFNVDAALAKLGDLVAKHGPQAVDLAAQVVQVDALGTLVVGAGLAVTSAAMAGTCVKLFLPRWRAGAAAYQAYCDDRSGDVRRPADDGTGWVIALVIGGGGAFAVAVAAAVGLLDVWSWVALFNPKLALAHQLLSKFAGI